MNRAVYVFNRDDRKVVIRLNAPEDSPENFSKASEEFAGAMRSEVERHRWCAAAHDDLSLWYRSSWGPWLPAWAQGRDHRPLPKREDLGGLGYQVKVSDTTTLRFVNRQPDW